MLGAGVLSALEGRHGAGGAPVLGPGLEELVVQDQTPGECGMSPGFQGRRGWRGGGEGLVWLTPHTHGIGGHWVIEIQNLPPGLKYY